MRSLQRNQTKIYYKNYVSREEIIDEYGNKTGSFILTYGELNNFNISISANKGETSTQAFGELLDYDRTMITTDLNFDIDENSILWLDGADTSKSHNFIIKKVARSLNQIQYAIKQVDINETN